jgi:hypothetical protein
LDFCVGVDVRDVAILCRSEKPVWKDFRKRLDGPEIPGERLEKQESPCGGDLLPGR